MSRYAVVITTINAPTHAVREIARDAGRLNATFVLIGDEKSPPNFKQEGAEYLDIEGQRATGFRFAQLAPTRHYARKNVGYLAAMRAGAEIIIETDDDNIPVEAFWARRERAVRAATVEQAGWCNVYRHFTDELIWPRGLPLSVIRDRGAPYAGLPVKEHDCPIQQGLADGDPDVDAIYRLVLPLPLSFTKGRRVVLGEGVWCPFNSQNTTFWRDAFPLLYLPFYCSWRMTDIWRSFIAQRIGWENGWRLMFHEATVFQDRNEHDLMQDFAEEVPGYLHNERIRTALEQLKLEPGVAAIPNNLVRCYDGLIGLGVVGAEEAPLLRAWLDDVEQLASQ